MAAATRTLGMFTTLSRSACPPVRSVRLMQARQMSRTFGTQGWGDRRSPAALAAAAAARAAPQRLHIRCMASQGEKSWSEIASEAAELGKDLVKKVGTSVKQAVSAIVPSEEQEVRPLRRESERRRQEDLFRPEDLGFGGGLMGKMMGKAVGSLLRSAVGALGEQLQQAAEEVAKVQDRATRVIEGDSRVRSGLGGSVQVMPPVSQSSSSEFRNGRATKTITLILPVVGSSGASAQAQVQYVEGAQTEELIVAVRMPNGEVVQLDGASSPAGQTIDVEWRSVDDK